MVCCPPKLSLFWTIGSLTIASAMRIPLSREQVSGQLLRRNDWGTAEVSLDQGFWFGNFTVGDASNLSLLIDTGSGDVILNPSVYKPGKNSHDLHTTFTNEYGTASSNNAGTITIVGDIYSDTITYAGLSVIQPIGAASGTVVEIPHQGIVGFSGSDSVQFTTPNATSFFEALCNAEVVESCRFGLALNSNGSGTLILGEADSTLYKGDMTVVPTIAEWIVYSDVAIDGRTYASDAPVLMDSGTAGITGPIDAVESLFKEANIQGAYVNGTLLGYFPCNKPPSITIGFALPSLNVSSTASSSESATFTVPSSAWPAVKNGNNNCTAVLSGLTMPQYPDLWIAGQAFFQGLYVDFNFQNSTMGFAQLVSTSSSTNASASSTSSSGSSTVAISGKDGFLAAVIAIAVSKWLLI